MGKMVTDGLGEWDSETSAPPVIWVSAKLGKKAAQHVIYLNYNP